MGADRIHYRDKYRFQLARDYVVRTPIRPSKIISTEFIRLDHEGELTARAGYAWDGASGPVTIQTHTFMRPSLVHDCFYQLLRQGHLRGEGYRRQADKLLRTMCLEDGMNPVRAWYVYHAVRKFGPRYQDPAPKPILTAPRS